MLLAAPSPAAAAATPAATAAPATPSAPISSTATTAATTATPTITPAAATPTLTPAAATTPVNPVTPPATGAQAGAVAAGPTNAAPSGGWNTAAAKVCLPATLVLEEAGKFSECLLVLACLAAWLLCCNMGRGETNDDLCACSVLMLMWICRPLWWHQPLSPQYQPRSPGHGHCQVGSLLHLRPCSSQWLQRPLRSRCLCWQPRQCSSQQPP